MNTVSCPIEILKGTAGSIVVNIEDQGTSPYIYKSYVDNQLKYSSQSTNEISHIFYHVFNENAGIHEYKIKITDDCYGTIELSCTINIVSEEIKGKMLSMKQKVLFAGIGIGILGYVIMKTK